MKTPKRKLHRSLIKSGTGIGLSEEKAFEEISAMITAARQRAFQAVNTTLVDLYWQIGEYLCQKIEADGWGKGTVSELSAYVQRRQPGIRGFSPQNLWRMRQFVENWRDRPKLSALLRELQWTQHLIILGYNSEGLYPVTRQE